MLVPVILSGGAGTRLWPLSRELHPKQLLALVGTGTLLQDTLRRLIGLEVGAPMVVCNEAHRFLVAEQLRAIDCKPRAIVLEPAGRNGALVTFGIVPTTAETGYGYIRRGSLTAGSYRIAEFVEKPDLARAQEFVASGDHYWNSGMFLFRARRYLEELERYAPDIAAAW